MGERSELLGKLVTESTISPETRAILFALREILHVQEEILEELRVQNGIDDEEQGPTSLSDP